jgi:alpha-N-arabinofuranosidase
VPGEESGVKQRVYLPLERERRYQGSVYVKGSAELKVALRTRAGGAQAPAKTLAEARIAARGEEWRKYTFTLEVPAGSLQALVPADFVMALSDASRVEIDQASLMPADAIDGLDPEMVALSKAMHTTVVRFGGNYTSAYHWPDGVGDRDKRVSMLNVAWGMPEYNTFGTDEFLHFCRLVGAEPQIALNLGTGTPEEAAAWVRYVNEHWNNGRGGLLWELGNELWGNWNTGYPTLGELAERTRRASEAVRKVDPKARLIATGQDPDVYEKWNATQLGNAPGTFDFLSTHFVVTIGDTAGSDHSPETLARAAYALPVELGRKLRAMTTQIGTTPHAGRAKLAFTEWLYISGHNSPGAPQYDNLGGALCAAGMLNMLMSSADIVPVSDMTGGIEFAGLWKKRGRVYATPSYHAFRMYASAGAHTPVAATADAGSYEVHKGVKRLPEIASVPYLDVVAALDAAKERLLLFCINRHLTSSFDGNITIDGFRAVSGSAETLKANSRADRNDEEKPHAVEPVRVTVNVKAGAAQYTFPAESVTVIELRSK